MSSHPSPQQTTPSPHNLANALPNPESPGPGSQSLLTSAATKFVYPKRPREFDPNDPSYVERSYWLRPQAEAKAVQTTRTVFIAATIADNAYINPEYAKILNRLSGWQKRAWLHGDWDIAAGQYFTTFRRDVHVIDCFDPLTAVEWFAAMDYGFTHYTVVLLGAKDGDGNTIVVDEHAARQWLPERHAKEIGRMLTRNQTRLEKLRYFVAGQDCFGAQYNGHSIASQYRKLGIELKAANTERVHGWAEILKHLGDPDHGIKPRLFIHARCQRLIECLPNLQHDPMCPEDVLKVDIDDDGNGGDDTADAFRYLISQKTVESGMVPVPGFGWRGFKNPSRPRDYYLYNRSS